jgi:non-canonical (house-cleaning) NTP pyrophosphatase
MTPPAAWKATGVPVKAIRELIRRGLITARLKNVSRDPKQRKYLVNADEVKAMAEKRAHDAISEAVSDVEGILNLEERARRIRARAEGGSNG